MALRADSVIKQYKYSRNTLDCLLIHQTILRYKCPPKVRLETLNLIEDIKVCTATGLAFAGWYLEPLDLAFKCLVSLASFIYVALRIKYLIKQNKDK